MPKLSKDYLDERKMQYLGMTVSAWGRGPYQHQFEGEARISISLGARPTSVSARGEVHIISSEGEVPICQQCWVEVPRVEVPLLSVVVPGRDAYPGPRCVPTTSPAVPGCVPGSRCPLHNQHNRGIKPHYNTVWEESLEE